MATVMFSRPAHDPLTVYLHSYSKPIIRFAENRGHKILNSEKENANKKTIESYIKKQKPHLLIFHGHGNSKTICGHNNEQLIKSYYNHKLLKSKIVYCLACSCAKHLGLLSVKEGTTAFIGYEDDFALGRDRRHDANPPKDKLGMTFLLPSKILVECLLKGNTVEKSVEKCKARMLMDISEFETSDEPEHQDAVPFLIHNMVGLTFHGDRFAFIS